MIAVFDLSQSYRSRDRLLPNRVISEVAKETLTKKGNLPKKERFFTLKGKCFEKRSLGPLEVTRRTGLRPDAHAQRDLQFRARRQSQTPWKCYTGVFLGFPKNKSYVISVIL